MKKIVTMGAIAVLAAGFMFADEPAADVSITEFSGNAKVTWGMDLDAGKTGFKNTEEANFKVKLFAGGDKVTTGEGTWAELKIKTDGLKLENGEWKDGKASVDAAKLHFGNIFVGIRSGDTQVGAYKFDGAIRSADSDHAKWIKDVGPANFKYGIEAGYDSTDFNVTANLRSYTLGKYSYKVEGEKDAKETDDTVYTNSYSISLEAGLKDGNAFVPGLFVNAGFAYNLSNEYYSYGPQGTFDGKNLVAVDVARTQFYTDYKVDGKTMQNGHTLGYSFNLGYKLALDDKYFVKPAVAFAGQLVSGEFNIPDNQNNERWYKASQNTNDLAFGLIFGWGSVADDNAGVPFLDDAYAKKVQPGVSVVVDIPLATTSKWSKKVGNDVKAAKSVSHDSLLALIVPSIHTKGELVEGLKASVYSEIGLLRYKDDAENKNGNKDSNVHDAKYYKTNTDETDIETWNNCYWKDQKFAFALAAGLKYDIKSGDYTITPAVGFRFVNEAYVENSISGRNPLSADPVFTGLGAQAKFRDDSKDAKKKYGKGGLVAGFFNLKAGVELGGLINNTTFSVDYVSGNLLNKTNYVDEKIDNKPNTDYRAKAFNNKLYNAKLGTLDIGCKIAF